MSMPPVRWGRGPDRFAESGEVEVTSVFDAPLPLQIEVVRDVARAEKAVRHLDEQVRDVPAVVPFLLRTEAIASSRIEGIAPSGKQVVFAELGQTELVTGVSDSAKLVANHLTLLRQAHALAERDAVTVDDLIELQRSLLPDETAHHGLRTGRKVSGGSDRPTAADVVPPRAEQLGPLVEGLAGYLNSATHAPIVQAALLYAQFDAIRPFSDGSARVGRALVQTVLARRGVSGVVLPISLALSTLRELPQLSPFRHAGDAESPEAQEARAGWVAAFANAVVVAAERATGIVVRLREVTAEWQEQFGPQRAGQWATRSDSAPTMVLRSLPATPVLTAHAVEQLYRVSRQTAVRSLEELRTAGILDPTRIGTGRQAYLAPKVVELINSCDRRAPTERGDNARFFVRFPAS